RTCPSLVISTSARLPPIAPQHPSRRPPASNINPLLLPLSSQYTVVLPVLGSNFMILPATLSTKGMSLTTSVPSGAAATPSVSLPPFHNSSSSAPAGTMRGSPEGFAASSAAARAPENAQPRTISQGQGRIMVLPLRKTGETNGCVQD